MKFELYKLDEDDIDLKLEERTVGCLYCVTYTDRRKSVVERHAKTCRAHPDQVDSMLEAVAPGEDKDTEEDKRNQLTRGT